MSRLLTICTVVSLLLPLSTPAAAQNSAEPAAIAALTASVNRLAAAIEAQQKNAAGKESLEKLNLAITYLSFRSRRIENLERDITARKNMRNNIEEAQRNWNERILALEEKQQELVGGEREDLGRVIDETKAQLAVFKDRQSRLGDEVAQMENRSYELQREINAIERYVERHLAF